MRLITIAMVLAASSAVSAQDSLVEWAQTNGTDATGTPASGRAVLLQGMLNSFPDRASFDAAYPDQVCEDFEDGNIMDGDIVGFPAPLDENTDNAVFPAGSIIPGMTIADNPINDSDGSGSANGLVGIGATAFGTPSDLVVANTFVDSIDYTFAAGQRAFAFDVFSFTAGGTATVNIFDAADTMIGSFSVAAGTSTGGFIGFDSPVDVGRINISSVDGTGADEAEGADNICLGAALPATQSVPAMSGLGLLLLILALGAGGFVAVRRFG